MWSWCFMVCVCVFWTRSCAEEGGPSLCSPPLLAGVQTGPDVRKRRHSRVGSGMGGARDLPAQEGVMLLDQAWWDRPCLCSQAHPTLLVLRAPSMPHAALCLCPLSASRCARALG